ncbi:MAG: hypothetical protein JSU66_06310, partial [Deltaproteobacteria bacterium]
RLELAIDGRGVMRILGCGPGPRVGRALRYLTDCVVEDPSQNTADRLRERLLAWAGDPAGNPAGAGALGSLAKEPAR